ncbi:hypothetical protein [Enterobacter sp. NFIX58]|uniref:hypothetical protein n=1 Tax=Enterobacter sp. NFIX58 TaxID=1566251 RepID=UPI0008D07D37|nr:hypothetical protein [Enterobacter sp. NFIX58]SEP23748.1 hypothetical protein SAMN03159286_3631 [Enterobacter sp. NFIX58]
MKMIVISDNFFYRNAFTDASNVIAVSPEYVFIADEKGNADFCEGAVVIISISDKSMMTEVLSGVMNKKAFAVFIEPAHWPARTRIFYTGNIYILPGRMGMKQLISTIRKCLSCTAGVFRINPDRVRASEWSAMLYLMSGISNRRLAQMLNTSEKTLSGRVNSLALKMGLSGLNKATQLNAMHLFYLIYTSRKSAEEKHYYRRQQAYITDSVRSWSAAV